MNTASYARAPPFVVQRNLQNQLFPQSISKNAPILTLKEKAIKEAQYCQRDLAEFSIPFSLLQEHSLESLVLQRKSQNEAYSHSIASCFHGDTGLVVHSSGAFGENIVLRHASHCLPHSSESAPGFTLPMKSPVSQILPVFSSSWEPSAHLMIRCGSSVHHVKTESLSDLRQNKSNSKYAGLLLNPLYSWDVENVGNRSDSIAAMCSASSYQKLAWLTDSGQLQTSDFAENRSRKRCNGESDGGDGTTRTPYCTSAAAFSPASLRNLNLGGIGDESDGLGLLASCYRHNVECSSHPQITWLSLHNSLYSQDQRCNATATSGRGYNHALFSTSSARQYSPHFVNWKKKFTSNDNAICAIKHHHTDPNAILLTTEDASLLQLDTRYLKTHVSRVSTPIPHSMLEASVTDTGILSNHF